MYSSKKQKKKCNCHKTLTTDSNKIELRNGIFSFELEILTHATAEAQLCNHSAPFSFQTTAKKRKKKSLEPVFPSLGY